ncbi:MAG: EAL domain-containing protein, partial [Hyphomicrobiaceae bacterium]
VGYDLELTITSLMLAILFCGLGFGLSMRREGHICAVLGGAIVGAGIGIMHYTGMQALVVPGRITWDHALVTASIVLGCSLAAAAVVAYDAIRKPLNTYVASGILVLAICSMHFTGMGAAVIAPDPTIAYDSSFGRAPIIMGAAAGILLLALLAAAIPVLIAIEKSREAIAERHKFAAAMENMSEGICMFDDDNRLLVCNQRYRDMYLVPPELTRLGIRIADIMRHRYAVGTYYAGGSEHDIDAYQGPTAAIDKVFRLADGRRMRVSVRPMRTGGWVATHEDITDRLEAEAKIAHMAHHDALTGLPNRVLFSERLEQALKRARRGEIIAVHLIDLDHFKHVNDTLGHPIGDKLLQAATQRLQACIRETDTVARMGGDEFAVVQVALKGPEAAQMLAERIVASIRRPFEIDDHQAVVGASIGISIGPSDGDQAETLIRNADLALYRTKENGRDGLAFYEAGMDAELQARRTMECDLRKALTAGEFELYYQPIVKLQKRQLTGFEALLRWNHPDKGVLAPGQFIQLAEEIGLIVPLGEWVIREACATASTWPEHLTISVNLSPLQFRTGLVQVIVNALAASGLDPRRLELEITESILLEDNGSTIEILRQLQALGVRIAMDDFGTGYSSLSYLQTFPFDKIKIDQSFVKNLETSAGSLSIVRAIAAMAKGMGITTTAEGVETEQQLMRVHAEGCSEMQGYLISRPVPASELEAKFIRHATIAELDVLQDASADAPLINLAS